MSFRRGFVQLLFAMLLLFAQQQALAHPIQHWHDGYPAQSDGGGKQKSHSELCDFHATFAELLGASGCALAPSQTRTCRLLQEIAFASAAPETVRTRTCVGE